MRLLALTVLALLLLSIPLAAAKIENGSKDIAAEPPPGKLSKSLEKIAATQPDEVVPVIILLDRGAEIDVINQGGHIKHDYKLIDAVSADIPAKKLKALASQGHIKKIVPDALLHVVEDLGATIQLQTSANATGAGSLLDAGYNGSGITVAVLDTGIDQTHPDLAGKVTKQYDFVNNDNDASDDYGHGTHVAGIIAANGGIRGVAPGASLQSVKVCDSSGSCATSRIIAGLEWAVENGAQIASISIGGQLEMNDGTNPVSLAADAAVARGLIVVIAAGNGGPGTGTISYPGDAQQVITVGAANDAGTVSQADDTMTPFSNRGPSDFGRVDPDVVAPGYQINSTKMGGGYVKMDGTSMATPHVSGAVALLLQARSGLTPAQVRRLMMLTSNDIGVHIFDQGAGEINVTRAVFNNLTADTERWETLLRPGERGTKQVVVTNNETVPLNITLGSSDLTDHEGALLLKAGNLTFFSGGSPVTSIAVAAGASATVTLNLSVPAGQRPGVYGGTINITANNSETLRIVSAISVPLVGSGLITGSVNDQWGSNNIPFGDFLLYPVDSGYNATLLDGRLNWSSGSKDLDLYLFTQQDGWGITVNTSGVGTGITENVSWNQPQNAIYWLAVHAFTLGSAESFNLTVNLLQNMSIGPANWTATTEAGTLLKQQFNMTNDGFSRNLNIQGRAVSSKASQTVTGTPATPGNCRDYDLGNYNASIGLNTTDLSTRYVNMSFNWTDSSVDMSLFLYEWRDNGDKTIVSGELTELRLSDHHNLTSEEIVMFPVWYALNKPDVNSLVAAVCTDIGSATGSYALSVQTFNESAWTIINASNSTPTVGSSEVFKFNVTANTSGMAAGNYNGTLSIGGSNLADVPISITITDGMPPRWWTNSSAPASPATYGSVNSFNVTWTDNGMISTVLFESNFSNSLVNYSTTSLGGGIYSFGQVLPVGNFTWMMYAIDSGGNQNATDLFAYSVIKSSSPPLGLFINGVDANQTLTSATFNITLAAPSVQLSQIYRNGTLIVNSTAMQVNDAPGEGLWNYTAVWPGDNNYTSGSLTRFLTVTAVPPSGGSTGGGGGVAGAPTRGKVEDITPKLESVGEAQIVLATGDSILFTLQGINHTIKPVRWTNETATITISSAPFNVTLKLGETRDVDVTGDSVNDIAITVVNLTLSHVTLKITGLAFPVPAAPVPVPPETEKPPETTLPVAESVTPGQQPVAPLSPILALLAVIVAAGFYAGYTRLAKKTILRPKEKKVKVGKRRPSSSRGRP